MGGGGGPVGPAPPPPRSAAVPQGRGRRRRAPAGERAAKWRFPWRGGRGRRGVPRCQGPPEAQGWGWGRGRPRGQACPAPRPFLSAAPSGASPAEPRPPGGVGGPSETRAGFCPFIFFTLLFFFSSLPVAPPQAVSFQCIYHFVRCWCGIWLKVTYFKDLLLLPPQQCMWRPIPLPK